MLFSVKPGDVAVTRYEPGSILVTVYWPSDFVDRVVEMLVPWFRTVTLAPTMAAPEESFTVPRITALLDCAMAEAALKTTSQPVKQKTRKLFDRFMKISPRENKV